MLAANHKAAVGSGYRPSTTVSQMMMPLFYMLRCGGDDISPYYLRVSRGVGFEGVVLHSVHTSGIIVWISRGNPARKWGKWTAQSVCLSPIAGGPRAKTIYILTSEECTIARNRRIDLPPHIALSLAGHAPRIPLYVAVIICVIRPVKLSRI